MALSLVTYPKSVPERFREISPNAASNFLSIRLIAVGFFSKTVLRVTVSTSVSDKETFTVNRSCKRCNKLVSESAFWPVPINKNLPSKLLQISWAKFCKSILLSPSEPINCCTSSSTTTVSGILLPKRRGSISVLMVSINCSRLILSILLKLALKFSFTLASFSANSGFKSNKAFAIADETNRFSYSFLKSLP